ncbi:MAG: DNA polymerase III subunit alpha [Flavobacteriales bacterium]|jgi:DNA polymerase-3 subunit alpha|nr:DNA polymerase III subunit alpha [Flavobacteriales bacterium]MBK7941917.1 DNA polymerase III subunit alpha [Flavobacteriales bacterium]
MQFSHLHVHTQFSLLDGAASIPSLFKKAAKDGQPALAITDHGNMFGAFKFVAEAGKHKNDDGSLKVKPIVGCEFYVVADRFKKTFTRDDKDKRHHQLMLAKNAEGYKNLSKLCSLGFMDGFYSKYPRIDKELILQYHEGLIATTCCLGASVPQAILRAGNGNLSAAEAEFKWWLDLFGEDYYVELQRHGIPEQDQVNAVLVQWARKYNVPIIASNDSHYTDQEDYNAHDILLCINTGEKQRTEIATDEDTSTKDKRFGFPNDQFFFKTQAQMAETFSDLPEALDNTGLIVDKVETLKLKKDILLPNYQLPEGFSNQDEYLQHLTYQGAIKRYLNDGASGIDSLDPKIKERLDFELFVIRTMGFAGYFLIVQDFINHGREIGVLIGPGRGSAAGSAVAYCIGITNIDPIKYDLLFERFLNPDRKSMPDIDTDFDDEGRQKVIDYVVEKYGQNQVAQIVTYGSMAAKSSIRDVARVMDLPLQEADRLAKLVPERPGIELGRLLRAPLDGEGSLKQKENLGSEELALVKQLREVLESGELTSDVLNAAEKLEGSVRGTGVHAAGIIIAPKDLTEILPVCTSKESTLLLTQYDGKVVEDAGVIKMDFLGLKTLTIIRDALRMIKANHGVDIDIDGIPLDDPKTYALYQRAETNGTFQFESAGMQKYLRELKADQFGDLIAMNALYRPGPLEYIPTFIKRKHGLERIVYDLPEMEDLLKETYGVTVYQEQVMLLSQKLAGFTKGDADVLRKAMGKKDRATLDKMKGKFLEGTAERGFDAKVCEKVWTDWEAFAQYAFNKSHSTCYAFVAYQTAWLKANYPSEYMASVLTHSGGQIDKITFFMEECRRMGISVLGPDVNESQLQFSVTPNRQDPSRPGGIRFGLGAVKGVGEGAVEAIVAERTGNGPFTSVFDLVRRVNLRAANRKALESLAYAGAFDSLKVQRAHFFHSAGEGKPTYIETLVRYGQQHQDGEDSTQVSMFDMASDTGAAIPEPPLPQIEGWSALEQLHYEKDVIGFYLSGHPLDDHRLEIKHLCNTTLPELKELDKLAGREAAFAGIVTKAEHRIAKSGKPFGSFSLEDHAGTHDFMLFSEDYMKFKLYLQTGALLFVKGRASARTWGRDEGQMEFKVANIDLLSDVREKYFTKLNLKLEAERVNDLLARELGALLKRSPGKCRVNFQIVSHQENLAIEAPSKGLSVAVSEELIRALEGLGDVAYTLN